MRKEKTGKEKREERKEKREERKEKTGREKTGKEKTGKEKNTITYYLLPLTYYLRLEPSQLLN